MTVGIPITYKLDAESRRLENNLNRLKAYLKDFGERR
jgi:hypothetical protein